jgi:hypothetical protein
VRSGCGFRDQDSEPCLCTRPAVGWRRLAEPCRKHCCHQNSWIVCSDGALHTYCMSLGWRLACGMIVSWFISRPDAIWPLPCHRSAASSGHMYSIMLLEGDPLWSLEQLLNNSTGVCGRWYVACWAKHRVRFKQICCISSRDLPLSRPHSSSCVTRGEYLPTAVKAFNCNAPPLVSCTNGTVVFDAQLRGVMLRLYTCSCAPV